MPSTELPDTEWSQPAPSTDVDLAGLDGPPSSFAAPFPRPVTDWRPLEELNVEPVTAPPPAQRPLRLSSVPPSMPLSEPRPSRVEQRRRQGRLFGALGLALIVVSALGLWLFPRTGALVIRLRTNRGAPAGRAEIFVDGTKHCDTDPCVVRGLPAGDRTVKVILPGNREPQTTTAHVDGGDERTLWIDVPASR
ncbi:MAG: hypothetical protein KC731_05910 [Myxococcales bacterium]|nr:hypothetical protein [Myxococcales bacterium]